MAIAPYGTSLPIGLILASAGKAVAQNSGLAGGYPGNTGLEVLLRGGDLTDQLAAGKMPTELAELDGHSELGPCYAHSHVAPGEVFYMYWQGGGGYGDPLLRDPAAVATDLAEHKVTPQSAEQIYGVVFDEVGAVAQDATARRRQELRNQRRARSSAAHPVPDAHAEVTAGRRIDDNLVEITTAGQATIACVHCGQVLGESGQPLALAVYEGSSTDAGPQIMSDPAEYVDAAVTFRQYCCPGCYTALYSAVVPADHPDHIGELGRLNVAAAS
jgi:N-methylhydantoinase B